MGKGFWPRVIYKPRVILLGKGVWPRFIYKTRVILFGKGFWPRVIYKPRSYDPWLIYDPWPKPLTQ